MSDDSLIKLPRLLVLVNRDMPAGAIERALDTARVALQEGLSLSAELVDSRDWYHRQFSRSGDWGAWIWETVTGKDYSTRLPHFRGFIICQEELGKANAQIVELALRNGRAVLLCQRGEAPRIVHSVTERDSQDWKYGWSAQCAAIGG